MKKIHYILSIIVVLCLVACNRTSIPDTFTTSTNIAPIYPTYQDVTIPVNIAPLSFELQVEKVAAPVKDMVTRYSFGNTNIMKLGRNSSLSRYTFRPTQ